MSAAGRRAKPAVLPHAPETGPAAAAGAQAQRAFAFREARGLTRIGRAPS